MKSTIPAHPHEEIPRVMIDEANRYHVRIDVSFTVPSRVAAHVHEYSDGSHLIPCAKIGEDRQLACRVRGWKRGGAKEINAALAEGCDTRIFVRISAVEWHLVGRLCGKLNITPGQWFLGCAAYDAKVAERELDHRLAELPAIPSEQMGSATPVE